MSIVFNFTGPVTIAVSGAGTFTLPASESPCTVAGQNKPFANDPDAADKAKLLELLNDTQYRFRNISTLAEAIDHDEEATESLLHVIGARQEANNSELWGLRSRVGDGRN